MPVINRISAFADDMTDWRRHIHAHPETAFEEVETSAFVAEKLTSFGVEVHRGLAKTGVVGTIRNGDGPSIGLRADMDALDIPEANSFDHKSQHEGKMHACGHDGHTTMLLGAARYLAETKNFKGTVHFIFQPAEENEGGGRVMVEEGLFDQFPVDGVYGLHNWPGLPAGEGAVGTGPMMAACDMFEIKIKGKGAHAAMPHLGVDPLLVAAKVVSAIQTIASRTVDPLDAVVVSVTQIHGGDTWNVIPDHAVIRGTARSFKLAVQDTIEPSLKRIVDGICQAHGATGTVDYDRRYPATINHEKESAIAASVMAEVLGADKVDLKPTPSMGSEDFAYLLQERPGCYVWLGNGTGDQHGVGGCSLHNPGYDFNDNILVLGASYWARLTERVLAETVLTEKV